MFVSLKPLERKKITVDQVIARLRPKLGRMPGATLYLQASQDLRVGGRMSNAMYQFTMRGDNLPDLQNFAPKMLRRVADHSGDRGREQRPAESRAAVAGGSMTGPRRRASASRRN